MKLYGIAKWIMNGGGRYSLSYYVPEVKEILDDSKYKGAIVFEGLTTSYFFEVNDTVDISAYTVPFGIEILQNPIQWVRDNMNMEERSEGVFVIDTERTDITGEIIPESLLTII